MTVAVAEPSGFASKWLPFQTAKRHVTNVKKPAKMFALSDWMQIAVLRKKLQFVILETPDNIFLIAVMKCLLRPERNADQVKIMTKLRQQNNIDEASELLNAVHVYQYDRSFNIFV